MTELDLNSFISENAIQCSWEGDDILLWIYPTAVQEFADLIDREDADDGGLDCKIQRNGTVVMSINEVLEDNDIIPEEFLDKGEQH